MVPADTAESGLRGDHARTRGHREDHGPVRRLDGKGPGRRRRVRHGGVGRPRGERAQCAKAFDSCEWPSDQNALVTERQ